MWKNYSKEYVRKNRASSLSVVAAAFISALFLSLLCSLFYNFWYYEVEEIVFEEGGWQGRISGKLDEGTIEAVENFENVKVAEVNRDLSDDQSVTVDIYFQNMRTIYQDLPLIAEQLGIGDEALSYHESLLSGCFIDDPQDTKPSLLVGFYAGILFIVSISLILIIHNSFAVSMNARIHQFGIFSSIGATPGQIRTCLLQEAAVLCIIPLVFGSLVGVGLSFGTIQVINVFAEEIPHRHEAVFTYHPFIFVVTILISVLTVFWSAWIPALRLSRLTPLEAIQRDVELQLNKKKNSRILSVLFGIEGELAGNALKAQKKAMRTSTLSLTLSFMAFVFMLCFFTLSRISTNHTYFERYQDVWDLMVTVRDTDLGNFLQKEEVLQLQGVNSVVYQTADALSQIPQLDISSEVNAIGGLEVLTENSVCAEEGEYLMQAPVVIMDDKGFENYCSQIGIEPDLTGGIVLNRIWDRINSNFRYKTYIPLLREKQNTITLQNIKQEESTALVPVIAYTQEPPDLREEYADYTLVQIIPYSLWNEIADVIGNTGPDTYIRVLNQGEAALSELSKLETELKKILDKNNTYEIENRLQEKIDNANMLNGYMMIIGGFCILLAAIGVANVYSNTLSFIRQRKREFARYLSVGMTPEGIRKIFCIEALVIAGRPVLITLPFAVLAVSYMITASYLNPKEFLEEAPVIPIAIFMLVIFGFVALAYYIGGRKIMKCNLIEAMRSDYII